MMTVGMMEGMSIIYGVLEYTLQNIASRSEGRMAVLKCEDGKEYMLYRENVYPVDDEFFVPYQGLNLKVEGKADADTDYFCVSSIQIKDEDKFTENNNEIE